MDRHSTTATNVVEGCVYIRRRLLQLKRFWIISFRMPARFTAVPKENLRKQRHATQRNTKPARGRAVSLTQIITTNPPFQAKTYYVIRLTRKNPCPAPSLAGLYQNSHSQQSSRLVAPLSPLLLSDRVGERESRSNQVDARS